MARLCGPDTLVASAQNGLDHEARLAPYLTAGRVAPALAYIAAERLGPGRVLFLAGNRLVVPVEVEPILVQAVGDGGLVVRGVTDMRTAAWQKLLGNLVANPVTALTMRRIGVMRDPGIEDLARGLLLEALQVGRADGARLRDEDVEAVLTGTGRFGERTGSSMLYDRLAGRPMEHQFLTGEVVRRGRHLRDPGTAQLGGTGPARGRGPGPHRELAAQLPGLLHHVAGSEAGRHPLRAHFPPALEGPAQGQLVGIFEVSSHR